MRPYLSVLGILLALAVQASGQVGPDSQSWNGAWKLDLKKSTFGPILFPGVPPNMSVIAQTLKIESGDAKIRLYGETTISLSGRTIQSQDDMSLSLDGSASTVGPAKLTFRPIDSGAFEIVTSVALQGKEYEEVSRFVFSKDGSLTETKAQTERTNSSKADDERKAAPTKSSTSVLIFERAAR